MLEGRDEKGGGGWGEKGEGEEGEGEKGEGMYATVPPATANGCTVPLCVHFLPITLTG